MKSRRNSESNLQYRSFTSVRKFGRPYQPCSNHDLDLSQPQTEPANYMRLGPLLVYLQIRPSAGELTPVQPVLI
ncbi:hypothetical protein RRG08_036282 [Elysia crispata]|uniref:Uncharacterized protein n=1 Tax=Elysia crispata TaxID=231223 RepID=A0AAE1DMM0_9GAST|nr:hypothetical protein RRG08_036282 [Elysia crispata]